MQTRRLMALFQQHLPQMRLQHPDHSPDASPPSPRIASVIFPCTTAHLGGLLQMQSSEERLFPAMVENSVPTLSYYSLEIARTITNEMQFWSLLQWLNDLDGTLQCLVQCGAYPSARLCVSSLGKCWLAQWRLVLFSCGLGRTWSIYTHHSAMQAVARAAC